MSDYNHDSYHLDKIVRNFYGNIFTTEAHVCNKCGSELWDSKIDNVFKTWLYSLSINQQKSFSISEQELLNLQKIAIRDFNLIDENLLIKAIVTLLNNKLSSEEYKHVINKVTLQSDFDSWKLILDLKDSELILSHLKIFLILAENKDSELKHFWNSIFKPDLLLILSA